MEESIGQFCKTLAFFCNHLHSSCNALKQSVDRRPVPLDSASSTFVQCLNRRVSSTSSDLNLLESMSFGTVSFEELLGHCNEVYKKNQVDILELEDQLKSFGYVPEIDINEEDEEKEEVWDCSPRHIDLDSKTAEEDLLFEDSLSLQNLGLSDACLATIASEANVEMEMKGPYQLAEKTLEVTEGEMGDELMSSGGSKSLIHVVKDDYESLPSYMKSLAPWEPVSSYKYADKLRFCYTPPKFFVLRQLGNLVFTLLITARLWHEMLVDLLAAVEKMNSSLSEKANNYFHQDEIASLDLGHKGRSYLLLLLRMNCLVVETIDGLISYRVLV
ncbi:hypothetical protein LguiA_024414 [Lonicera macranthoides]